MSLHYSRYNYEVILPDGNRGIYNLATGQKLKLETPVKEFFEGILSMPQSKLARKWKQAGFLAEGDELTALKLLTGVMSFSTKVLGLTITPTTACNFRCPYCFEDHTPLNMNQEVQDKLVAMVEKFFVDYSPREFSVTWYGGEPLLQPGIIEDLSHRFMELCGRHKVEYRAFIITNGYLLTQEIADMLGACKVSECQITLDGLKECNDRTRILADGTGSFDVIVDHLRNLHLPFKVYIRTNLTQNNKKDYPDLEKLVQEIVAESGNDLLCYSRPMDDAVALNRDSLTEEVVAVEEWLGVGQTRDDLFSFGSPYLCACATQCFSSFVVAPDGSLYKCWEDVTCPERRVADLLEDKNPFAAQMRSEWGRNYLDAAGVLEDPECRECQLLPVCRGGCPHQRVVLGAKQCIKSAVKNLNEYVLRKFVDSK